MFNEVALRTALLTAVLLIYIGYNIGFFNTFTFLPEDSCSLSVNKNQCKHEWNYCHLNIWKLAKQLGKDHPEDFRNLYAVFLSSSKQLVHTWLHYLPGSKTTDLITYNYHVILVFSRNKKSFVYDFESGLPFPADFKTFCSKTFPHSRRKKVPEPYRPLFRVIRAETYVKTFWPFWYPRINYFWNKYVKMQLGEPSSEKYGEVLDLNQFIRRFS